MGFGAKPRLNLETVCVVFYGCSAYHRKGKTVCRFLMVERDAGSVVSPASAPSCLLRDKQGFLSQPAL